MKYIVICGAVLSVALYYIVAEVIWQLRNRFFRRRLIIAVLIMALLISQTDIVNIFMRADADRASAAEQETESGVEAEDAIETLNTEGRIISAFTELPGDIKEQVVPVETALEELMLPDTLEAVCAVENTDTDTDTDADNDTDTSDSQVGGGNVDQDEDEEVVPGEGTEQEDETSESSEDDSEGENPSEKEEPSEKEDDTEPEAPSEQENNTETEIPSEEEHGIKEEQSSETEDEIAEAEVAADIVMQAETGSFTMPEYRTENVIEVQTLEMAPTSETIIIENITWQSEPEYDGNTEGEYIFTAVLPEGYKLIDMVEIPRIFVTVVEDSVIMEDGTLIDGGTILLSVRPYDEETSSDMVYYLEEAYESYSWEVSVGSGLWTELKYYEPELVVSKEEWYVNAYRCIVVQDGNQYVAVSEEPLGAGNGGIMLIAANTIPTGSGDYMNYGPGSGSCLFNIHGLDNGTQIQTTFLDRGYYVASSVGGASKVNWSNGTGNAMGNSLFGSMDLSLVYGGKYVKIEYRVENKGSAAQSFQVGSSADVMIGNNDYAPVVGNGSGLIMSGAPKNDYTFSLSAPTVDTLWYGHYSSAYSSMFTNLADRTATYDGDSGVAWSWNGSVEPGKTWSRYVLVGVGELPDPTSPPVFDDKKPTLVAGKEEHLTGTADPGNTVYVVIEGEEYSAIVDDNGRFDITVTLPEDMLLGETQMNAWAVSPEGGVSDTVTGTATVITSPYVTLTDTSVDVMEEDSLTEEWYRSFIKDSYGTVTHTTIDTGTLGSYMVDYTASSPNFPDGMASLTVNVLPKPLELSAVTATRVTGRPDFTLSAALLYPGGETITETGFVWGVMQNPTVEINNGKAATSSVVKTKNGTLQVTAEDIADTVNYYARAYVKTASGYYYSAQNGFDIDAKKYGSFSITSSGNTNTFTITRTGGADGEQKVYYRTVNGSAIGGTHFKHTTSTDCAVFAQGETSKTVTITEYNVYAAYSGDAGTKYSNADRTYQVEIYRVEGGGTLDDSEAKRFASRTMALNSNYKIDRSIYTKEESDTKSDITNSTKWVIDHTGGYETDIYFVSDRSGYNNNPISGNSSVHKNYRTSGSVDRYGTRTAEYLRATADSFLYRFFLQGHETEDGWEHVWIGDFEPDIANVNEKTSVGSAGKSISLTDTKIGSKNGLYSASFLIAEGSSAYYYFPDTVGGGDETGNGKTGNAWLFNTSDSVTTNNGTAYVKIDIDSDAMVYFAANGKDQDRWYVEALTDYMIPCDNAEPQLLDVAPMAGGAYKIGDTVTIALVFDEIVDKTNSTYIERVTVKTNWGTFSYKGGADTNVLYFTGTITSDASGSLQLQSINNPGYIKDMCSTAGTATKTGTGTTSASVDTTQPTVSITNATRSGVTATATVEGTGCDILQYTWTQSPDTPVTGWLTCSSASSATVNTRQTSGIWYLHVLGTNANNSKTAYTYQSFDFDSDGTAELPELTLSVDNSEWAQSRDISVTRKPSDATVTVKTPTSGTASTVSGATYTATANGTYTFTLTSGGDTVVKTATVSRIDRTNPSAVITGPETQAQTENVRLTITPSDSGGSGVKSVTGQWLNGGSTENAVLSRNVDGTYSVTTPAVDDTRSTWQLKVIVTDNAGNSAMANSLTYTVNLKKPAITVTKISSTNKGDTYSYTINDNGNTITVIQLPDGSTTTDLTGSFTLTSPGIYYVVVSDEAGHVVYSEAITVTDSVDGTAPEVRLYQQNINWTSQPETIDVSVYEEGRINTAVWKEVTGSDTNLGLAATAPSVYGGSFKAAQNGTYAVIVTDANGNTGTAEITVSNIDKIPPAVKVEIPAADGNNGWFRTAPKVTVTYEDGESGIESAKYAFVSEKKVPAGTDNLEELPESGIGEVRPDQDCSFYLFYIVTDKVGNTTSGFSELIKVDATNPQLVVDGQATGQNIATGLTFSVSADTFGPSGGYIIAAKSGTAEADAKKFIEVSEEEAGGSENGKTGTYRVTEPGTYYFKMYTNTGKSTEVTRDVYEVSFDSKGGSEIPAQLVWSSQSGPTVDCKVVKPASPVRKDGVFENWYMDEACTAAFDFDTQVKGDITLYANWTICEHEEVGDWEYDANSHWKKCKVCGTELDEEEHTWDDGILELEPSETRAGRRVYTCEVCDGTKTETIPKKQTGNNSEKTKPNDDGGETDSAGNVPADDMSSNTSSDTLPENRDEKIPNGKTPGADILTEQPTDSQTKKASDPKLGGEVTDSKSEDRTTDSKSEETAQGIETPDGNGLGEIPNGRIVPAEVDGSGRIVANADTANVETAGSDSNGAGTDRATGDSGAAIITGTIGTAQSAATILAVGDGAVIVTVVSDGYQSNAGVADTVAVANMVLTPKQIQLVNSGERIEIRVEVKDISDQVSKKDKDIIENGLKERRASGMDASDADIQEDREFIIGAYIDISVYIKVGDGDWDAIAIAQEPIEIVIGIPKEIQSDGWVYYIARSHGETFALLNDLDSKQDTITMKTELFSTYAIVYRQAIGADTDETSGFVASFSWIAVALWCLGILVILGIVLFLILFVRRREEEEDS